MPRPPYRKYEGMFGLLHRCLMLFQTVNSGCVSFLIVNGSKSLLRQRFYSVTAALQWKR